MTDQDDFTFDEQDSDSEEWYEEESEKIKKKGGSSRRLLLLLLLLVVIAAAGYYFMLMPQDDGGPAAPPKAIVKITKKPMTMPAKQPVNKPAPARDQMSDDKPAEDASGKPMPAKMPASAAKPAESPSPAPMPAKMPEESASVPATAKPVTEPGKVFETSETTSSAQPQVAGGAYTLSAGAFLLDSSVKSVSKKIRALGYEPMTSPVQRKVSMTRLKIGTYPLAEAEAKKAELKTIAPGVFGIRNGNMETLYAGSYLVLDKARRYADKLYNKGIKLEEEPVQVEKTLQRITFGSFADAAAAGAAARQAAAKGVEAKVVKNK